MALASRGSECRVLIVDDSGYARLKLRRFLVAEGWRHIEDASDCEEALDRCVSFRPSLVILDQVMRGRGGLETARLLLAKQPDLHIIMLTVISDPLLVRRAAAVGVLAVVKKTDWESLRAHLDGLDQL